MKAEVASLTAGIEQKKAELDTLGAHIFVLKGAAATCDARLGVGARACGLLKGHLAVGDNRASTWGIGHGRPGTDCQNFRYLYLPTCYISKG